MGDPMRRRDLLKFGIAALSAPPPLHAAWAQSGYPDRPVRLIVPFPPGGAYDTIGRPWADRMKNLLGTLVIENIGGAGGGVGAAQAARSRPDGYTLLLGGATTHITEGCSRPSRPTTRSRTSRQSHRSRIRPSPSRCIPRCRPRTSTS